jgi:beta-phosphoglucomutase-like phosphatase (HAD superfamily)
MKVRFIDKFEVVLLDMGRTFMFDIDRFSDSEDYEATYRLMGGGKLTAWQLRSIVAAVFNNMASDARNPSYYEQFPSVVCYIRGVPEAQNLPDSEIVLLEQVFASHEVGRVPGSHAEVLHRLHETHRLGIISDIWSKSDLYFRELERAGIRELFEVIVFSSDHGRLKPSPYPFTTAIEALNVERSKVVYVGDSLRRDIAGAKAAGLSAVWISDGTSQVDHSAARPDLVVEDLRDLIDR